MGEKTIEANLAKYPEARAEGIYDYPVTARVDDVTGQVLAIQTSAGYPVPVDYQRLLTPDRVLALISRC